MDTEQELQEYAKNNAVVQFSIVENKDGKFNLFFSVSWKKEVCVLASARQKMRPFANVNTLITFIKNLNVPEVPISIQPFYQSGETKNEN